MKLSKRKIKFSLIFLVCWFALLVFFIDGLHKFENILAFFGGSYPITETILILLVIIPTVLVYLFTKSEKK